MERRYVSGVELRAISQDGQRSISGHAAKWNRYSEKLGGNSFREMLKPGAFTSSLQDARSDVTCLMNHDPSLLLGRQRSGTLRVKEDSIGLHFRCSLPDTTAGNDAYNLIQRGDLRGCSFAFQIPDGGDSFEMIDDPEDGSRIALRTITRASLLDCSVVTSPAYPDTDVSTDGVTELNSYFPIGGIPASFPAEVRSRIMTAENSRTSRKNLIAFILQ